MKSKRILHGLSYILTVVLLFCTFSASPGKVNADSTLDQLKAAQAELERKIADNKSKMNSLKSEMSRQEEYLNSVYDDLTYTQNQLDNLQSQIEIYNNKIKEVEDSVATLKKEVSQIDGDIEENKAQIKKDEANVKKAYSSLSARLRSSYITGEGTNLKILLSSDSIATFLTRLEMMKLISQNDASIINDFKAEIQVLKASQETLENRTSVLEQKQNQIIEDNQYLYTAKNELKQKESSLKSTMNELQTKYNKVQSYINQLDKNSQAYKTLIARQEAEEKAAEAKIDAYLASYASNSSTPGGRVAPSGYICPLRCPGVHVTSPFGTRVLYGRTETHGGLDLSAPNVYGQNIYAARAGTIIYTDPAGTATSYGKYVIIDHGDGYLTLYGHCSQILVSKNQYVQQGQVIAKVGDTGRVTGPHLHFEVRKDNVRQNPRNYINVS